METISEASQKYGKKYILLIIAVLFVLLLAIPYSLGYRLGSGLHLERISPVIIKGLPRNASIVVDGSYRGTTKQAGNKTLELVNGGHAIIVSVPGDYPWSTVAAVSSHVVSTINPIFVSITPMVVTLDGAEKATALSAIAGTKLPTTSSPLWLAQGCAQVYVSNNQVIAAIASSTPGCVPAPYLCDSLGVCSPTIIFSPVEALSSVQKYPGRQDALVLEFSNGIYALALDPRNPQFFAPILTGTAPVMGALPDGAIVVRNEKAAYRLSL